VATLELKPTHKPIQNYYASLSRFEALGIKHEGAVRSAFHELLDYCGRQFDWKLVPEYRVKAKAGNQIAVDGGLLDNYGLVHGYWEAKDSADDLDKQIVAREGRLNNPKYVERAPEHVVASDRAILIDATGRVLDGDHVMLMCAKQMQAEGRLCGNAVVATVMSNIGLELAMNQLGIDLIRTKVGDKYVMEEMQKRGLSLGGEQSGHLIFSEHLFTGDGLITVLNVLRTMAASGRELADLADDLKTYPQVLLNVRVRERKDLEAIPEVAAVMTHVEEQLGGNGRLLVRYSGTEPLLRVMLEGQNLQQIEEWAGQIADAVDKAIGER
jgi:hypothetical protein